MGSERTALPAPAAAQHASADSVRKPSRVQAKLAVGAVGDRHEVEADRIAAQVMSSLGRPVRGFDNEPTRIQRASVAPAIDAGGGEVDARLDAAIRGARGGGRPLDEPLRGSMERSFGVNFSAVRIHAGRAAGEITRSMQATAATTGRDIFFSEGAYHPSSTMGQRLIAHELTHVVQQGAAAPAPRVQRLATARGPLADDDQREHRLDEGGARAWAIAAAARHRSSDEDPTLRVDVACQDPHAIDGSVVQLKRVANLASGTDINTMMKPPDNTTEVVNLDTGHMVIADVLIRRFDVNGGGSLAPFATDLWPRLLGEEDYAEIRKRLESFQSQPPPQANIVLWPFVGQYIQAILQVYLKNHPGSAGAKRLYERMRDRDKYEVVISLQEVGKQLPSDYGFMLGDATRLPLEAARERFDEVHIINAYGFSPLDDEGVYGPIYKALKPGGLLFITAEATGPTVSPMLGELSRPEKKKGLWTKNGFPAKVPKLPIMDLFKYLPDRSGTIDNLGSHPNPLVSGLATRHTVGATEMMSHIPTVFISFQTAS